jgi:hypothetical protein
MSERRDALRAMSSLLVYAPDAVPQPKVEKRGLVPGQCGYPGVPCITYPKQCVCVLPCQSRSDQASTAALALLVGFDNQCLKTLNPCSIHAHHTPSTMTLVHQLLDNHCSPLV